MKYTMLIAAVCGTITALADVNQESSRAVERTAVDFTAKAGKIRRELHSAGWGGQLTGPQSRYYLDLKPLNLFAARTHDWALVNSGQRILDYYHVFPLLHADTQDPKNYFFAPSDEILEMTIQDLGMNVMYRMGTSIESVNARRNGFEAHPPRYYNSVEPSDWLQFAKVHAQIIRHYTEGWANGYHWGDKMRYWELWNEPNDMPGGSWIIKSGDKDQGKNNYTFNSFYIYVLKYLKAEFPHLKFGGPAVCYFDRSFLRALLDRCAKEGYTPDFISWHSYGDNPRRMLSQPAEARKMLDEYGFKDTELVINEWHWFHDNWWGLFKEGPAGYSKLLDMKTGVRSIEAAVYALQVIMGLQTTCLDQSYYYGCSHQFGGLWGYRNDDGSLGKSFYTLKLFGDVVGACDEFVAADGLGESNPILGFGAWSRDGSNAYLIATSYCGKARTFEVAAKGTEGMKIQKIVAVDAVHSGEEVASSFVKRNGDVLEFTKPDAESSAAYLVVFGK